MPCGIDAYHENKHLYMLYSDSIEQAELLDKVFEEIYITLISSYDLLSRKEFAAFRLSIDRAIELIQEGLINYLNIEYDIGKTLLESYNAIIYQLIQANKNQDLSVVYNCISMMQEIRFSFAQINNK